MKSKSLRNKRRTTTAYCAGLIFVWQNSRNWEMLSTSPKEKMRKEMKSNMARKKGIMKKRIVEKNRS